MTVKITAQDGTSGAVEPLQLVALSQDIESGNVVHQLIAPGTIAVTMIGDLPPAGQLELTFVSDTEAAAARALLGRATSFLLEDSDRATLNFTFVRQGRMSAVIHDQLLNVWQFSVGYQEIVP